MDRKKIFLLIAALILGAYWLFSPESKDDREFLEGLPSVIAGFAEKKQADEVKRFISRNYRDDKGRAFVDLNRLILYHVFRGGEI